MFYKLTHEKAIRNVATACMKQGLTVSAKPAYDGFQPDLVVQSDGRVYVIVVNQDKRAAHLGDVAQAEMFSRVVAKTTGDNVQCILITMPGSARELYQAASQAGVKIITVRPSNPRILQRILADVFQAS